MTDYLVCVDSLAHFRVAQARAELRDSELMLDDAAAAALGLSPNDAVRSSPVAHAPDEGADSRLLTG